MSLLEITRKDISVTAIKHINLWSTEISSGHTVVAELCRLPPVVTGDTGTEIWDMGTGGGDSGWHFWLEGAW